MAAKTWPADEGYMVVSALTLKTFVEGTQCGSVQPPSTTVNQTLVRLFGREFSGFASRRYGILFLVWDAAIVTIHLGSR